MAACGGKNTSACPEGTTNCACRADLTCDSGLACSDGFCVAGCHEGAEGCPCYPNGTCDSKAGVAMACQDSKCVVSATPVLGDLDDPCDSTKPCGKHQGTQLECRDDTCQLPQVVCPAGTLGCPCDGVTCQAGLVCTAGQCAAAAGSGLFVGSGDVRACDVLVEKADGVEVLYDASVLGVTARDDARLALSFTAKADSALAGPVGALVGADGKPVGAGTVSLAKTTCYDRHGSAVAAPGLELK
jgi:hypothetical protein